ncbi:hypothetical protein ACOSP7_023963 [Xanthoceras sorbifolium]
MGTINLFVKSVLVLVTWRCSVIADMIALLLRVTTTTMLVTILVQLLMGLYRFRHNRTISRAISLVMPKAVVIIICRMAKVLYCSPPTPLLIVILLMLSLKMLVNLLLCMLPMLVIPVVNLLFYHVKALM